MSAVTDVRVVVAVMPRVGNSIRDTQSLDKALRQVMEMKGKVGTEQPSSCVGSR
jgi:hypothetical protein